MGYRSGMRTRLLAQQLCARGCLWPRMELLAARTLLLLIIICDNRSIKPSCALC